MNNYLIPTSISVADKEYKIRNDGDYRTILDCFEVLNDVELTMQERIYSCLIIFYEDFNSFEDVVACEYVNDLVAEMYKFFNCNQTENPVKHSAKLIDWNQDSQLICSAINKIAGREIRFDAFLHWWTFIGYYLAIGDSAFTTVVTIRNKIVTGKKLEKYERQFRNDNPQYFVWDHKTLEQQEADQWLNNMWNSGKEVDNASI